MEHRFRDTVLLVEDTPSLSMVYQAALERAQLKVEPVFSAREAQSALAKRAYKIILLDLMLPDGNGLDILKSIKQRSPGTKTVVITADGSINRAVEAMRSGAFDFLVKPFDDRRLFSAVKNAISSLTQEEHEQSVAPERTETDTSPMSGFVGSSAQMMQIYRMIRSIGKSTATVFITGESGTGKEIAAHAIHAQSNRQSGPFIPINCGAIPRDLLESEVFGHLKGSFTGAISDKIGAAAAADGGTLFLDEICEMDLALQTKLLRFLQTSMIQPVGAVEPRKIDVRIVCATNRDPAAEVQAGRFREDLFYRLHVVPINMPPLRDRGDDVIEIADMLLRRFSKEENKSFRRLSIDATDALRGYPWPGNVRQLENTLRNAVVLNDGIEVTLEMMPSIVVTSPPPANALVEPSARINGYEGYRPATAHGVMGHIEPPMNAALGMSDSLKTLVGSTLADVEREFIEVTIRECDGSIPRAARILDVSPSTLYRKREAWERSVS
ncbi:MAG: sigma-54 dependent transcriptional regulator [Pseudomonadota bacterium]